MRIPVVFATDENYLFYVCVAITSMAQNAKEDSFYQIYILVAPEFTDPECLLDKVQQRYNNIHIEIICVDRAVFQNVTIHNQHVTQATFYRLLLCNLIAEEKCIYLDGDILVTEDLGELYQTELGEYYLAGCRDIWPMLYTEEDREKRRAETGLPSMEQYINAGVLLLNLKQLRKDNMNKIFIEELGKDHPYEDQDILNLCCYDRILHLPAKWNLFTIFMGQAGKMREAGIEESVIDAFRRKSGIIHYATPYIRPWERTNSWLSSLWWQMAEKWSDEPVFRNIRDRVLEKERKMKWDYYVGRCRGYSKIVIFGYTGYGRELSDWVGKIKSIQVIAFCDNDSLKQGTGYKGIPVLSLQKVLQGSERDSALFLIASQTRAEEVRKLLMEQGVHEDQIEAYKRKDESYYLYLDEVYYMDELQDICKKEDRDWKMFESLSLPQIQEKILNSEEYQDWKDKFYVKRWLLREY